MKNDKVKLLDQFHEAKKESKMVDVCPIGLMKICILHNIYPVFLTSNFNDLKWLM